MIHKRFVVAILALGTLGIYLFVSAPPLLPEQAASGTAIPIERLFALVEAENDTVRALWTVEMVGKGRAVGLRFDEHWRDEGLDAGPLPSLFLRETAKSLEKDPVRLSLFLGSDFPVNPANRFQSVQMEKFVLIRHNREPQFFYAADTGLFTAMFADIAVAPACIQCHNEHADSPKKDWRLDEVMGATTWSYPDATVSPEDALRIIAALRNGFRAAYAAYLVKVDTFAKRPEVGRRWPRDGYFLPTPEVFMAEIEARVSGTTLNGILAATLPPQPVATPTVHPAGVSEP